MLTLFASSTLAHLQASFLAIVLPKVRSHGRACFRGIQCPYRREDAIQEMIGLAWQWHLKLAEKGKDATRFPTVLASYAACAVRTGRRLCGQNKANDVLSSLAQQRHYFTVGKLPDFETLADTPVSEALYDNTQLPDKIVCFMLDFIAWLASLSERDRDIVEEFLLRESTIEVADKHKVSPARISQKKRKFCQSWRAFCGDLPESPSFSSTSSVA